eukprot:364950-Chlamydomonas_euryale.AAC.3
MACPHQAASTCRITTACPISSPSRFTTQRMSISRAKHGLPTSGGVHLPHHHRLPNQLALEVVHAEDQHIARDHSAAVCAREPQLRHHRVLADLVLNLRRRPQPVKRTHIARGDLSGACMKWRIIRRW